MRRALLVLLGSALLFISSYGLGGEMLVGGFTEPRELLSMSKEEKNEFRKVGLKAVEMMNEGVNSNDKVKLTKIISVSTQVVAGVNYDLKLEVLRNNKFVVCHLLVSNLKPWEKDGGSWSMKAMEDGDPCSDLVDGSHKEKRHVLGGEEEVDEASQPEVEKAARWAVEHLNSMSNSFYRSVLGKISNVKKQIVNGVLYHLELELVPTMCRNSEENKEKSLEECPASNDVTHLCDISVVDKRGEYSMKDFNCEAMKESKLPVIGGDDHDYKAHEKRNHLIGGDDHDYKSHSKSENSIDSGNQEYIKHAKRYHLPLGLMGNLNSKPFVHNMNIEEDELKSKIQPQCMHYLDNFNVFKAKHSRVYGDKDEETDRFKIFCENMEKVKEIQKNENGSAVYGATQFADMSEDEFRSKYLGLRPKLQMETLPQAEISNGPIPDSWDWRDHGAVTPVKNQGSCGSCWAFSTTGNIEGQYFLQHKKLISLSEQELVDCDKLDEGCNGGLPSNAYKAIMDIGGIETESDYKYEGDDEKCKFDKTEIAAKVSGAVNISQNEDEIAAWLYHNGPISIGINAFAMQFYFGGIAHPWKMFCNPKSLDHGVLIVGYGKQGNEPYWIIKNSWGPGWGREGYYYVYRGDGTCGLNTMCTSAKVD